MSHNTSNRIDPLLPNQTQNREALHMDSHRPSHRTCETTIGTDMHSQQHSFYHSGGVGHIIRPPGCVSYAHTRHTNDGHAAAVSPCGRFAFEPAMVGLDALMRSSSRGCVGIIPCRAGYASDTHYNSPVSHGQYTTGTRCRRKRLRATPGRGSTMTPTRGSGEKLVQQVLGKQQTCYKCFPEGFCSQHLKKPTTRQFGWTKTTNMNVWVEKITNIHVQ